MIAAGDERLSHGIFDAADEDHVGRASHISITLPMPPVMVISASPPSKRRGHDARRSDKDEIKIDIIFLEHPASWAIQGIDCDMTRAEYIVINLSAAPRVPAEAEPTHRPSKRRSIATFYPTTGP